MNYYAHASAIIGKNPQKSIRSRVTKQTTGLNSPKIGNNVQIGANVIIYNGTTIEDDVFIADGAIIREKCYIGSRTIIGCNVVIENKCVIGYDVKIQTGAYITAFSQIEANVFVSPCVITTNDNTMGKHDGNLVHTGVIFRNGSRIGAGAMFKPGISVGENAVVGMGAVVTRDVEAGTTVIGNPAREMKPKKKSFCPRCTTFSYGDFCEFCLTENEEYENESI